MGEYNMASYLEYETPSAAKSLFNASSIALDGVLIYPGTTQYSTVDPFYPTSYGAGTSSSIDEVDTCMGRTDFDVTYYYRTASPCLQRSFSPS